MILTRIICILELQTYLHITNQSYLQTVFDFDESTCDGDSRFTCEAQGLYYEKNYPTDTWASDLARDTHPGISEYIAVKGVKGVHFPTVTQIGGGYLLASDGKSVISPSDNPDYYRGQAINFCDTLSSVEPCSELNITIDATKPSFVRQDSSVAPETYDILVRATTFGTGFDTPTSSALLDKRQASQAITLQFAGYDGYVDATFGVQVKTE